MKFWILLLLAAAFRSTGCLPRAGEYKLVIMHTNDMHARFEQTNVESGKCSDSQATKGECYGGFARVATAVKEERAKGGNVIFINGGDTYQGTVWYTVHKWNIVLDMIPRLGLDAMSLGNHEFDDGVAGLAPLVSALTIPVVSANVDLTLEPTLTEFIKPSTVLTVGDTQIGVIGYVTPETKELSNSGQVVFKDEVASIKAEAARLKGEGVKILIAVGHSGYAMDQTIAKEVEDIDLVVGAHTHTFIYTGTPPSTDVAAGLYPTMVTQASGRKVPVVTAYAYTKYMGRLEMTFDTNGEMVTVQGLPILLDKNVVQDPGVLAALDPWREKIAALSKEQLGRTRVYLNGTRGECRMRECNMGNMLADAFVQYNAALVSSDVTGWTDAAIAFENGGGIRNPISEKTNEGRITLEDVISVLPFQNTIVKVQLLGKHLRQVLEHSVTKYDPTGVEAAGRFLQYSGILVAYDLRKAEGKRVVQALVRCADCRVPRFEPIDPCKLYGVLMSSYLAGGGDGYTVISQNAKGKAVLDATESDIAADYVKKKSPLTAGLEGRIRLM